MTTDLNGILARAEGFFETNRNRCFMGEASVAVELLHKILTRAREMQSRIDALQTDEEVAGWKDDYEYLSLCRETKLLDIAKKWHAAYRKAQNSNLIRKQEAARWQKIAVEVMQNCNGLRNRCWMAETAAQEQRVILKQEAARWQAVAVEERANVIYLQAVIDDLYVNEECLKGSFRNELEQRSKAIARKELGISEEAGDLPEIDSKDQFVEANQLIELTLEEAKR